MNEAATPAPNQHETNRLKHNLWFGYIVFLILWSGSVYYWWFGERIYKHELFARVIDGHPYVSDFVNVYNSASLAAACQKEKIDIYSPELQAEYAKKLTAPVVAEQPFYLQYPPMLFAVVRPLAFVDILSAWLIWCSMGMALLISSAVYLVKTSASVGNTLEGPDQTSASSQKTSAATTETPASSQESLAASDEPSASSNKTSALSDETSALETNTSENTTKTKDASGDLKIFGVSKFTLTFIIFATVAAFPTWLSIELGQTSLLLVPGLVAFWLLCQKRRYFYAGLVSGVVMIKLQYLPPVFLIGFLIGGWPYLGGFTTIGIVLLGLSVLMLGVDNVMHFPQALLMGEKGKGFSGVAADQMQNLRGTLTLILGNDNAMVPIISIAVFALALAVLAFLWWRASKTWWREDKISASESKGLKSSSSETNSISFVNQSPKASQFRVLASISMLTMLVVSPHCHTQDYLALVIPGIWLWFEIARLESLGKIGKGTSFLKGMILFFPLLGWPFYILRFFFQLAKIQPFFIWAVIVIILSSRIYADMQKEGALKAQT
jgi:Flp pilus assembly protein TadB